MPNKKPFHSLLLSLFLLLTIDITKAYANTSLPTENNNFFFLPWWLMYLITALLVLGATWLGFHLAVLHKKKMGDDHEGSVNSVVGALMGLLAFILAFTFGVATNKFDARKGLLLEEVTAIEKLYMRAGLIPEPYRSEVRSLVKEYVHLRVELANHPEQLAEAIDRSHAIQKQLWKHAEALPDLNLKHSDVVSLFTESLSDVVELQTKRITVTAMQQLPPALWLSLYLITFLSMMGIGYLFGMAHKANWTLLSILSLAFSVVIILIADLDNSNTVQQGIIKLNKQPMIQLEQRLSNGTR